MLQCPLPVVKEVGNGEFVTAACEIGGFEADGQTRIVATLSRHADLSMDYADATLVQGERRECRSGLHPNDAQVVANVVRRSVIHCGIFMSDASSYPRAWPAVQEGGLHERREQTVRIE
jgi:hypothetical protein